MRRDGRRCASPAEFAALFALLSDERPPLRDSDRIDIYESLCRPTRPQGCLIFAPPNTGLITGGQPAPTGLADREGVGQ